MYFQKNLSSSGFTLIEAMIAVLIIGLSFIVVISMFPLGVQTAKSSQMMSIADELCQAKIEELLDESYEDILVGVIEPKHQLDSPFNIYSQETIVRCVNPDLQETDCDYDLETNPYPLKKVTVTVFWNPSLSLAKKESDITTFIAKR